MSCIWISQSCSWSHWYHSGPRNFVVMCQYQRFVSGTSLRWWKFSEQTLDRSVKHKAGGPESAQQRLQSGPQSGNCEGLHRFLTSKSILQFILQQSKAIDKQLNEAKVHVFHLLKKYLLVYNFTQLSCRKTEMYCRSCTCFPHIKTFQSNIEKAVSPVWPNLEWVSHPCSRFCSQTQRW